MASPVHCAKIGEFTQCVTNINLDIAKCSSMVQSVPNLEFYICQCTAYKALSQCYWLCPEDASLMGQQRDQESSRDSVCSQADALRLQGATTIDSTSTSLISLMSTTTTNVEIPTTTLPKIDDTPTDSTDDPLRRLPTVSGRPTERPRPALNGNSRACKRASGFQMYHVFPVVMLLALVHHYF